MKHLFFLLTLLLCLPLAAQRSDFMRKEALMPLVERLTAFGRTIPQEKVYVHMDNTCYFQGDTIWFAAYTRQTTDDLPSRMSGVLYVELLNNDGYLVERKLVEMHEGRGNGFFALNNSIQYSGFYELRAYTRWQLNWGQYYREHPYEFEGPIYINELTKARYLDYEKLYSRVFPVYDRPKEPGDYIHDMTLRSTRRYYRKNPDSRDAELTLYPEGGNLVAGLPCRVAFEATWDDGEWLTGTAPHPSSPEGEVIKTLNRGRGVFTIVPEKGMEREVVFTAEDGQTVKAKLPKPEEQGVALSVTENGKELIIKAIASDSPLASQLGMTIMHEGRVEEFLTFRDSVLAFTFVPANYYAGVHQVTVFDREGHVWADRIFFSRGKETYEPNITVKADKKQYGPQQPIVLDIETKPHPRALTPSLRSPTLTPDLRCSEERGEGYTALISLAVRDKAHQDVLYDNANILVEMLLSSEIRGFVPDPGWFFEADDSLHRAALDLLMMTQGWRRFNWRDMAVKGAWDLSQPNEKSPVIVGEVFRPVKAQTNVEYNISDDTESNEEDKADNLSAQGGTTKTKEEEQEKAATLSYDEQKKRRPDKMRNEVRVHAELVRADETNILTGDIETNESKFRIQLPRFYGKALFFLAASDTTKWKEGEQYTWIQQKYDKETAPAGFWNSIRFKVKDAEFLVRTKPFYPRFVLPYHFYQNHLAATSDPLGVEPGLLADGTRVMQEVSVRARHGGMRRFDDSEPVLVVDAYEGINTAIDMGYTDGQYEDDPVSNPPQRARLEQLRHIEERVLEAYIGEMGVTGRHDEEYTPVRYGLGFTRRSLPQYRDIPIDSLYLPKYLKSSNWMSGGRGISERKFDMSPGEMLDYDRIAKLDRFFIYTDFSPRLYGDKRFTASNYPENIIAVYPYPDASRRAEYRDRRYLLNGFAEPAEFYSPNYSRYKLPEGQKDYRRTLYWNPNLKLDAEGRARVTLFNNSRTTQIEVEAAGQAADGTLLWNK